MKKFKLFTLALLICFIPLNINAKEEQICKPYESENEKINAISIMEFENSLKFKIKELNKTDFGNYTYRYSINVGKKEITTKKYDEEIVEVEEVFNTEEDAINYFNNIFLEEPYYKGNYITSKNETITTSIGEKKQIVCQVLDCSNEIKELKEQLTDNQELSYRVNINTILKTDTKSIVYKNNDEIVYFNTKEEAENFAKNYTPTFGEYDFIKNEIKEEQNTETKNYSYSELEENDIFNTEEEALEKLNAFQEKYNTNNGTINKIRNNNNTIINETLVFDNEDKFNVWLNENYIDSTLGSLTYTKNQQQTEIESINGTYKTKEEAEQVVKELQDLGYVVEYKIEKVQQGITGEVINGTKYDKDSKYIFPYNDTNYVLIKQGSTYLAVWSEFELTNEERNTFVTTYNNVNNFDGSTKNITIDQITWISGFGSFDLTHLGRNWGTYEVSKKQNNIVITSNDMKVSHVIKGYATPKINYVLSGKKHKESEALEVSYEKIIYGFSYKIDAEAPITSNITKYSIISNFKKEIEIQTPILTYNIITTLKDNKYSLKYNKYKEEIIELNNINWRIEKCGYENDTNQNHNYPLPPYTGINIEVYTFVKILLGLFTIMVSIKIVKLIKNN